MGVLRDILSVVSMLSVESVFYTPRDKKLLAERARQRFFHDDGMCETFAHFPNRHGGAIVHIIQGINLHF
jgi:hypothetical protein